MDFNFVLVHKQAKKELEWCNRELTLCSTIFVYSATRHNIHMYPYFLLAAIHHLIVPDFLCPAS